MSENAQREIDDAMDKLREIYEKYQNNSAVLVEHGLLDCQRNYLTGRIAYHLPELDNRGPWEQYFKIIKKFQDHLPKMDVQSNVGKVTVNLYYKNGRTIF